MVTQSVRHSLSFYIPPKSLLLGFLYLDFSSAFQSQANARMQAMLDAAAAEVPSGKQVRCTAAKVKAKGKTKAAAAKPSEPATEAEPSSEAEENSEEEAELTQAAKEQRLRRACERKPSGALKVPEGIHQLWAQKGHSRNELLKQFEDCDWQLDPASARRSLWLFVASCVAG